MPAKSRPAAPSPKQQQPQPGLGRRQRSSTLNDEASSALEAASSARRCLGGRRVSASAASDLRGRQAADDSPVKLTLFAGSSGTHTLALSQPGTPAAALPHTRWVPPAPQREQQQSQQSPPQLPERRADPAPAQLFPGDMDDTVPISEPLPSGRAELTSFIDDSFGSLAKSTIVRESGSRVTMPDKSSGNQNIPIQRSTSGGVVSRGRSRRTTQIVQAQNVGELRNALQHLSGTVKADLDHVRGTGSLLRLPSTLYSDAGSDTRCAVGTPAAPASAAPETPAQASSVHSLGGRRRSSILEQLRHFEELRSLLAEREEEILECVEMGNRVLARLQETEQTLAEERLRADEMRQELDTLLGKGHELRQEAHGDRVVKLHALEALEMERAELKAERQSVEQMRENARWEVQQTAAADCAQVAQAELLQLMLKEAEARRSLQSTAYERMITSGLRGAAAIAESAIADCTVAAELLEEISEQKTAAEGELAKLRADEEVNQRLLGEAMEEAAAQEAASKAREEELAETAEKLAAARREIAALETAHAAALQDAEQGGAAAREAGARAAAAEDALRAIREELADARRGQQLLQTQLDSLRGQGDETAQRAAAEAVRRAELELAVGEAERRADAAETALAEERSSWAEERAELQAAAARHASEEEELRAEISRLRAAADEAGAARDEAARCGAATEEALRAQIQSLEGRCAALRRDLDDAAESRAAAAGLAELRQRLAEADAAAEEAARRHAGEVAAAWGAEEEARSQLAALAQQGRDEQREADAREDRLRRELAAEREGREADAAAHAERERRRAQESEAALDAAAEEARALREQLRRARSDAADELDALRAELRAEQQRAAEAAPAAAEAASARAAAEAAETRCRELEAARTELEERQRSLQAELEQAADAAATQHRVDASRLADACAEAASAEERRRAVERRLAEAERDAVERGAESSRLRVLLADCDAQLEAAAAARQSCEARAAAERQQSEARSQEETARRAAAEAEAQRQRARADDAERRAEEAGGALRQLAERAERAAPLEERAVRAEAALADAQARLRAAEETAASLGPAEAAARARNQALREELEDARRLARDLRWRLQQFDQGAQADLLERVNGDYERKLLNYKHSLGDLAAARASGGSPLRRVTQREERIDRVRRRLAMLDDEVHTVQRSHRQLETELQRDQTLLTRSVGLTQEQLGAAQQRAASRPPAPSTASEEGVSLPPADSSWGEGEAEARHSPRRSPQRHHPRSAPRVGAP